MELGEFVSTFETVFEGADEEAVELQPTTNFKELSNWDSLTALNLIAIIDENYGVLLSVVDIRSSHSIEDLFKIVKSKRG